jgi:putative nucleotidyltransferase with HDIG domain
MSEAGITREKAFELLTANLKAENLVKHCLASEAIMRDLAPRFDGDPEAWGITGLLHDIDLEVVDHDPEKHAEVGAEMLIQAGLKPEYAQAIRRHKAPPEQSERSTTLDHALAAAETITGLIVATALVYPDKKLASVKPKSVRKRIKEPRFAAGANRDHIRECEKIGLELPEFVDLSLEAMKKIAPELGL